MVRRLLFIKHANEARGIGGRSTTILNTLDFDHCFAFTARWASFLDAYLPIVEKRKALTSGERERQFQLYRRGRYVEFNPCGSRHAVRAKPAAHRVHPDVDAALVRWEYITTSRTPTAPAARRAISAGARLAAGAEMMQI